MVEELQGSVGRNIESEIARCFVNDCRIGRKRRLDEMSARKADGSSDLPPCRSLWYEWIRLYNMRRF